MKNIPYVQFDMALVIHIDLAPYSIGGTYIGTQNGYSYYVKKKGGTLTLMRQRPFRKSIFLCCLCIYLLVHYTFLTPLTIYKGSDLFCIRTVIQDCLLTNDTSYFYLMCICILYSYKSVKGGDLRHVFIYCQCYVMLFIHGKRVSNDIRIQ